MKPTRHGSRRRRAFLIFPLFILPLLLVAPSPPGAADAARQISERQIQEATAQTSPGDAGGLKFTVTVTGAKGGFITGLTRDDFSVWEGKTRREINYFYGEETPASVGVLIDVSGSVRPRTLADAKYAVTKFVELGHPANEYSLGEFNHGRRALTGWTRDAQQVLRGLDKLAVRPDAPQPKPKPGGQTAFYDACAAALDGFAGRPHPKYVLLLITDAEDNSSRHTFTQLRRKVQESNVQIYGLGLSERNGVEVGLSVTGQAILDELAGNSGGIAYFPDDKKSLDEMVERIAVELRYQYVVGFAPTNAAPGGKWNKVKIKVTPAGASSKDWNARSREGYFSPPPPPAP
jgi:Ca-activated chloride channel family protein